MMHRFLTTLFLSTTLLIATATHSIGQDIITLNLPESVISKAAAAILPLNIDANSKSIQGEITVINITELQLTDQHLACRLHLAGNNLAFVTEIAGHEIKLKVGTVEINFKTNAAIRFDESQQTLYIKPMVEDVSEDGGNTDIGKALVALLNGREFPVDIQTIEPLIAKTGAKTITIGTRIANIEAKPHAIQLSLIPSITAK